MNGLILKVDAQQPFGIHLVVKHSYKTKFPIIHKKGEPAIFRYGFSNACPLISNTLNL